jgi:hypothetical protein
MRAQSAKRDDDVFEMKDGNSFLRSDLFISAVDIRAKIVF